MKLRERKHRRLMAFAFVVGAAAVLNGMFWVVLYQPALSAYRSLNSDLDRMRMETASRLQSVADLERLGRDLDASRADQAQLMSAHFLPRHSGFSRILPELEGIAAAAGVRKSRVDYSIADEPEFGVHMVRISIPVQGSYTGIVNFIRRLETSSTFFILESIDVRNAEQTGPDASAPIALSLNLVTYFSR